MNDNLLEQLKPDVESIVKLLCGGKPTSKGAGGKEWRYGANGGLSIDISKGIYQDFSTGESGGILQLIEAKSGQNAIDWLVKNSFLKDKRGQSKATTIADFNNLVSAVLPVKVSEEKPPLSLEQLPESYSVTPPKQPETYVYTDADGQPSVKIERSYQGDKRVFKQYRFDTNSGDWVLGLKDSEGNRIAPHHLYRLPQLIASKRTIHLCEGEKCADRLVNLGLTATTSGSASSWRDEFAQYFAGRSVIVWQDNDSAGDKFAQNVIKSLSGVVKTIKRINLAHHVKNAPEGYDVADFIDNGGQREQLEAIAQKTPFFEPLSDLAQQVEQAIIKVKPVVTFTRASDAMANANKPIPWLIDGFLIQDTLTALVGKPSSGKSLIALSMAASVATGTDWHWHKTQKGSVFYIAGEGQWGVSRRLKAWEQHNQVSLTDTPLYLSNHAVMLDDAKSVLELIDIISASGEQPSLVVIDTLQRSFSGDENSASDMSKFIAGCDLLRQSFKDCVILLAHHSGHSENRARGSSAFHASLDTSYMITDESGVKLMTQNKTKDGKPAVPIGFEVVEVAIFDEEQSITIKPTSVSVDDVRAKQLTDTMRLGIETFARVAYQHRADLEAWRVEFYKSSTRDTTDSKRASFNQVRNMLTSKGIMTVDNDVYTLNQKSRYPEVTGIMVMANFLKAQNESDNSANDDFYEKTA